MRVFWITLIIINIVIQFIGLGSIIFLGASSFLGALMEIFYILVLYSLIVMKKWALIAYVVIFFVRLVNIINSIRYASIFGESLYYWLNISELILMIIILVIGLIEYKEMD